MGLLSLALAEDTSVVAKGLGTNRQAAINDALIQAVEQKTGVRINSTMQASHQSSDVATSTTKDGFNQKRVYSDASQMETAKNLQGYVSGYEILSEGKDASTGLYAVELRVRIPSRYVMGTDPNARRRMVVGVFTCNAKSITTFGETFQCKEWAQRFRNELMTNLTQSRKFTMLDRDFDAAINNELARLSSPNASAADLTRLGQQLGTDYLVVGSITFYNIRGEVNKVTGYVNPLSNIMAEVNYRVLLVATGQLKWIDTVKIDIRDIGNARGGDFVVKTTNHAASQVAESMMSNILPPEIVAILEDNTLVIGEGGKAIAVGDEFKVFVLGEDVKDTRTGEVIDALEKYVGKVKVTNVLPKMSHAILLEGDINRIEVGARLRRIPKVTVVVPPPTTVKPLPNGGVDVPF